MLLIRRFTLTIWLLLLAAPLAAQGLNQAEQAVLNRLGYTAAAYYEFNEKTALTDKIDSALLALLRQQCAKVLSSNKGEIFNKNWRTARLALAPFAAALLRENLRYEWRAALWTASALPPAETAKLIQANAAQTQALQGWQALDQWQQYYWDAAFEAPSAAALFALKAYLRGLKLDAAFIETLQKISAADAAAFANLAQLNLAAQQALAQALFENQSLPKIWRDKLNAISQNGFGELENTPIVKVWRKALQAHQLNENIDGATMTLTAEMLKQAPFNALSVLDLDRSEYLSFVALQLNQFAPKPSAAISPGLAAWEKAAAQQAASLCKP